MMRHPTLHRILHRYPWPFPCPANWRWYRRWQGGHWEEWIIDVPVASVLWLDFLACTRDTGGRPPLGRGTPTCETWP